MDTSVAEIERTFDLAGDEPLPDLADLPGVVSVDTPDEVQLDATYFDTVDLRLAAARMTLRRRTGGSDAGWHLKAPTPDGERAEERRPLGRAVRNPPRELCSLADGVLRGRPVAAVAHLVSHRTVHRLRDDDGTLLAEVSDDRVEAELSGTDLGTSRWREVVIELVHGDADLLGAATGLLGVAGARPARISSKLLRALGDLAPAPAPDGGNRRFGPKSPAGDVLTAHLGQLVAGLRSSDLAVRRDADDAVHRLRITARRIRSVLASFRPLFDGERTEPLREELAWLIGLLGAARDIEVDSARLLAAARAEPVELRPSATVDRIQRRAVAQWRDRRAELVDALSGARYFTLLDALDALVLDPPLTRVATRPARAVLPSRVAKCWQRVLARAVRAEVAGTHAAIEEVDELAEASADGATFDDEWLGGTPALADDAGGGNEGEYDDGEVIEVDVDPDTETALHDLRKAARRARYAADAVRSVWGPEAERFARRMKQIQDALGAARDARSAGESLRALAVDAHATGEDTFCLGRLHALEQIRASAAVEAYPDALSRAAEKKIHRWLS